MKRYCWMTAALLICCMMAACGTNKTSAAEGSTAAETVSTDTGAEAETADTDTAAETFVTDGSTAGGSDSDLIAGSQTSEENMEYSPRTLLITVDENFSKDDASALCEKYGLTIVYDYDNFSMYAVSTERDYSDQEMSDLIGKLEKEDKVLDVERDAVMHLDDSTAQSSTDTVQQ